MPDRVLRHATLGAGADIQHLVFYVSERALGVALRFVSEILPYENVSAVPGLPAAVRGVVHVRGRMLPVMDSALRLGLTPQPPSKRACIVMLDASDAHTGKSRSFAITADRVSTLLDIGQDQIQPVPDFGFDLDTRFLAGLYQMERVALPLIAPAHLFDPRELDLPERTGAAS